MVNLVWATAFLVATWILRSDPSVDGAPAWLVAAVPTVLGVVALLVYRQYLHEADELAQRIQLEGVALGFGVGLLFSLCYPLFVAAGAAEPSLNDVGTVMIFGFIAGVILATRRYR